MQQLMAYQFIFEFNKAANSPDKQGHWQLFLLINSQGSAQ